jgi:hypothetical protein
MDTVNVFAPELRGTVRKDVPFIKGAWVEFFDDITMDVIVKAQELNEVNKSNILANLDVLVNQIAFWNFADQDGKLLDINIASIQKLPMKLLNWIATSQTEILKDMSKVDSDKKKELPVTS